MKIFKRHILVLLMSFPTILFSQGESVFNKIEMEESVEIVAEKLAAISESTNLISVANPTFPLAEKREEHLICTKVRTEFGELEKVVFTFADNKLKYILSNGNVTKVFTESRKDTSMVYMDYEIYMEDKLFVNQKKDLAWIISNEAMHPNLFTWVNPYLESSYEPSKNEISMEIPTFLEMGATLEKMKLQIEKNSDFSIEEKLDGSDPNAQIQINGFGVDGLGFPRKIEARFGDGKLNVVWILTGKGEEERIRTLLIAQFGAPIFVDENWEIFNNWQVGLRKDKPEVLLLEQEIGLAYKKSYFKQ